MSYFCKYADDVNIVGENIDTTQRNTKALLDVSKEVGLEVNPEKTRRFITALTTARHRSLS
jgi:hypothetical protein